MQRSKKLLLQFFCIQIVFCFLTPFHLHAQGQNFTPPKTPFKKRIFFDLGIQYQQTSGGDYKIPSPPFSYHPVPVSMSKKTTVHYQFRGTVGYSINKNFGVSIGITHSTLGQDYSDYSGTEQDSGTSNSAVLYTYTKKIKLSYLNFPIQLHYHTSESKPISFACYIGIYYARLTNYTDIFSIKGSNSYGSISQIDTASGNTFHDIYSVSFPWVYGKSNSKSVFSGKPFKSYDIGELIGIGMQKKISVDGLFFIMLNYQSGFIDIKNIDSKYSSNNYKYYNFFGTLDPNQFLAFKNSLVGINLGFKIKL